MTPAELFQFRVLALGLPNREVLTRYSGGACFLFRAVALGLPQRQVLIRDTLGARLFPFDEGEMRGGG